MSTDGPKIPPAVPCDRCGRSLPPGSDRYVMTLRFTADFDGYIPDPADGETLEAAVALCFEGSEDELEAQVDERLAFTVCPRCRKTLRTNPLQKHGSLSKEPGGMH